MSKNNFNVAKNIFLNRDSIIEKYAFFDEDREEFLKGIKLDETNIAQFIVFLLMNFNASKAIAISKPLGTNIELSILNVIRKNGKDGITIAVLKNKLKNIPSGHIETAVNDLFIKKQINNVIVTPKRGSKSIRFFVPQL